MKKSRLSQIRKELLEIFNNAKKPLSHHDVNKLMEISKSTFYRNTLHLQEKGILDSVEGNDKRTYFEIKNKQHAHFMCSFCNQIECVEIKEINLKDKEVISVMITGICPNCNKSI